MSFIAERNGQPLLTPAGRMLALPTAQLAQAVASEWIDIKGSPRRGQIPLTQLANTAIDHIALAPEAAVAGFLSHAESELLCYRASAPPPLVARQTEQWQPWLDWARGEFGAEFSVFSGLMPQKQNPQAIAILRSSAAGLDPFRLLALSQAAGLTGSAVLAFALLRGQLDYMEFMELALLEEFFQSQQWGEPEELVEKRESLQRELSELAQFIRLLA